MPLRRTLRRSTWPKPGSSFNQGLTLREKGDAAGAVERFKAAHALAHTPLTGLELGRTYALLRQLVEAREAFLSVARIPLMPEETFRAKTARSESALLAEQLRPRIPSLTVRITGVPADSVAVTIDGANVPTEALAAPRLVDPGSHNVFARSTSGGTAETKVELGEGDSRDVELKIVFTGGGQTPPTQTVDAGRREPAPFSLSDTSNGQSSTARSRVLEWSLMGAGAAVGAAGAVLHDRRGGQGRGREQRSRQERVRFGLHGLDSRAGWVPGGRSRLRRRWRRLRDVKRR